MCCFQQKPQHPAACNLATRQSNTCEHWLHLLQHDPFTVQLAGKCCTMATHQLADMQARNQQFQLLPTRQPVNVQLLHNMWQAWAILVPFIYTQCEQHQPHAAEKAISFPVPKRRPGQLQLCCLESLLFMHLYR